MYLICLSHLQHLRNGCFSQNVYPLPLPTPPNRAQFPGLLENGRLGCQAMLNWPGLQIQTSASYLCLSRKPNGGGKNKMAGCMALAMASLLLMGLVLVLLSASEPQYLEYHYFVAVKCTA